ncbi:hypothetical protein TVAG_199350 [Trichomonas vaginalis G3]|uniref:Uncharacterized protein n=1 Tax=Trichomonas vaginalis (strain ATCC PRA-98 / G3) TaxID=412133 RepID=A2DDX0_TRIV3|nr:hypothetical protein TVAG_199350 [Trichomonas vaginalis G3]|eukprot:XP_001582482.1 hypothetical protein [Trichomonas vaginalis G3]
MFSDDNSENEMGITSDDISELNELAGHDKNFTEFQNLPSIPQLHQNIIEKLEKLIESIHHLHETNDTEPLLICIDNVINLVASSNRRITILDSKVINDTVGSIMSVMMIENDLIRTKIVELLTSLCDLFQFLVNNDNSQQFSFILQQLILSNNQDLSKKTKKFLQKLFEVQDNSTQLLFILYSFIMSNVSSNILENDIDLQIIRQFVNKLNGSSQYKINMQQLFIFLAPYFRLSPVDGKIPDVTVYSSWILADIFSRIQ